MELKDTIEMMNSPDYQERFKAEYWQCKIRQHKLYNILVDYKAGMLTFTPRCSYDLLFEQCQAMGKYILLLEARAKIEGIDLWES